MTAAGALTMCVLALAIPGAAVLLWRRPALALPIFAIGFALHSFVLMWLIHSGVPSAGVRAVQAWKEAYVGLLALRAFKQVIDSGGRSFVVDQIGAWRRSPALVRALDVIAVCFGLLLIIYLVLPSGVLGGGGPGLAQRLIAFRAFGLIPTLYIFGRFWSPLADINWRWVTIGVIGTAALVAVLGIIELWFIPTRTWADWGIIQFDEFLGFHYGGPGGLPENFFQSTSSGLALRRMVSTYLSPLGVAYTALLVIPMVMAVAVLPASKTRRRWIWLAMALIVLSLAMSITRLALLCGAVEAVVLAALLRRRVVFAASGAIVAAMALAILVYPNVGPLVAWDLTDLRPPAGDQVFSWINQYQSSPVTPGGPAPSPSPTSVTDNLSADMVARAVSGQDESIHGHFQALNDGAKFVAQHPLGVGLGGAVPRYGNGNATAPGESALLQVGEETGLLGFFLFVLLYGILTATGLIRAFFEPLDRPGAALSLTVGVGGLILAPIVLTSQVWGDFSVTFFFWLIAGSAVTAWSVSPWRPPFRHAELEGPQDSA